MSHPKDKRERFLIGKKLGKKRALGYYGSTAKWLTSEKERADFIEKEAQIRRDTTKLCSCIMCKNPRRANWSKKDKLTMQERKFNEFLMESYAGIALEAKGPHSLGDKATRG